MELGTDSQEEAINGQANNGLIKSISSQDASKTAATVAATTSAYMTAQPSDHEHSHPQAEIFTAASEIPRLGKAAKPASAQANAVDTDRYMDRVRLAGSLEAVSAATSGIEAVHTADPASLAPAVSSAAVQPPIGEALALPDEERDEPTGGPMPAEPVAAGTAKDERPLLAGQQPQPHLVHACTGELRMLPLLKDVLSYKYFCNLHDTLDSSLDGYCLDARAFKQQALNIGDGASIDCWSGNNSEQCVLQ